MLVVAVLAAIAVPTFLNQRAKGMAANQPDVLTHTAPRSLAGQPVVAVPGLDVAAQASDVRSGGSTWAWVQTYGKQGDTTVVVAADVAPGDRAATFRALTDATAARGLIAAWKRNAIKGSDGALTVGEAVEYSSPVGGKVWCMPATISGTASGSCLWTNGKEMLEMLAIPGSEALAAKRTMTALTQLEAARTTAP